MSALLYLALRRLGVANARLNEFGRVTHTRITAININIGAPAPTAPSLDFSVADNSMYLGLI